MYMLAFSARSLYNSTIKEKLDAPAPEGGPMKSGDRYTTRELCLLVREMERLFEVVRLLDPAAEERLIPISEDRLERGDPGMNCTYCWTLLVELLARARTIAVRSTPCPARCF